MRLRSPTLLRARLLSAGSGSWSCQLNSAGAAPVSALLQQHIGGHGSDSPPARPRRAGRRRTREVASTAVHFEGRSTGTGIKAVCACSPVSPNRARLRPGRSSSSRADSAHRSKRINGMLDHDAPVTRRRMHERLIGETRPRPGESRWLGPDGWSCRRLRHRDGVRQRAPGVDGPRPKGPVIPSARTSKFGFSHARAH